MDNDAETSVAIETGNVHQRGAFHGCYLLVSKCPEPKFKNRAYIGYTVDPNRRIKQHNGGKEKGGAKKTSDKGPWDMTLIVHGFPSEVAGLRFEWAWQNPERSRRLRPLALKKIPRKESQWEFRFRVLAHMLTTAPWARLRLTLQWLLPDYRRPLPVPCPHTLVRVGLVGLVGAGPRSTSDATPDLTQAVSVSCPLCDCGIRDEEGAVCPAPACVARFHLLCLARAAATLDENKGSLIPFHCVCPFCSQSFNWMELVRRIQVQKMI